MFLIVDEAGIVALTNRARYLGQSLWPRPNKNDPSLFDRELKEQQWKIIHGDRQFVERSFLPNSRWSLVVVTSARETYASRVLGIVITLLSAILILTYLLGKERQLHDQIQMGRRLDLQELASDLRFQASTDPLTGLNNRLKFNEALTIEAARAERYREPLSLVLFDIDHFKSVNDTFGHLAGDMVLVELARLVSGRIRKTDLLARWGGEEFAVLLPATASVEAVAFAEDMRVAIAAKESRRDWQRHVQLRSGSARTYNEHRNPHGECRHGALRRKEQGRNRVEIAAFRSNLSRPRMRTDVMKRDLSAS